MSVIKKRTLQQPDKNYQAQKLYIVNLVLLFVLLFLAFWISWRNLDLIKEVIRNDFNKQQLVLARQVAHGVKANIEDIQNDLRIESHYKTEFYDKNLRKTLSIIFERLGPKGISKITFVPQKGVVEVFDSSGLNKPLPIH